MEVDEPRRRAADPGVPAEMADELREVVREAADEPRRVFGEADEPGPVPYDPDLPHPVREEADEPRKWPSE